MSNSPNLRSSALFPLLGERVRVRATLNLLTEKLL